MLRFCLKGIDHNANDMVLGTGMHKKGIKATMFRRREVYRTPRWKDSRPKGAELLWLDPQKLAGVNLMPSDLISAIQNQNTEVAAGEIGGLPAPEGQMLNAAVTAQSRFQTPEQFRNIIVKSDPTGT